MTMAKATAKKATAAQQPQQMSNDDLLNDLMGNAPIKAPAASKKAEIYLTGGKEFTDAIDEFAASAVIAKIAEEKSKADNTALKDLALDAYCDLWIKQGTKPENPLLTSPHASVKLQVKELYKPAIPEGVELNVGALKNLFVEQDFTPAEADEFVSCAKLTMNLSTKSLDKLLEGTPEEQDAARAAMKAIREHLTPAQRSLVLESKPTLVIDAATFNGKLSQICQTKDKLLNALSVAPPQLALSQPKHDNAIAVAQARFKDAVKDNK